MHDFFPAMSGIDFITSDSVGIEPPDYFPGLPYAALMISVGEFVLDPRCQYSRQSCQNRARLRNPDGVQWITVPLTAGQYGRSISNTRIDYEMNWVARHLKALRFNYGSTPFYEHYIPEIENLLYSKPEYLGDLSAASVQLIHRFLNSTSTLHMTGRAGGDSSSGKSYRPVRVELEHRITSNKSVQRSGRTMRVDVEEYRQNFDGFESGLSILDLLFNHGPGAGTILKRGIKTVVPNLPDTEHQME